MSTDNLTESGFEPETSGLTYRRPYQPSYPALFWWPPNCQLSLLGVGCQSEAKIFHFSYQEYYFLGRHGLKMSGHTASCTEQDLVC